MRAGRRDVVQPARSAPGSRAARRTSCAGWWSPSTAKAALRGRIERRLALWRRTPDFLAYDVRDLPSRFAAPRRGGACPSTPGRCGARPTGPAPPAHADQIIFEAPPGMSEDLAPAGPRRRFVRPGRLGPLRRHRRPVPQPRLPVRAGGIRAARLRAPAGSRCRSRSTARTAARAAVAAGLCEEPQPGRICVRPWLGRRLGAGRRRLLSQAADRGAVHAGAGPAAARPTAGSRARPDRRGRGGGGAARPLLGPRHLHRRGGGAAVRARRLADPGRQPVPLAQSRLCGFEDFLAALSSRKRKTIRRERAAALEGLRSSTHRRRDHRGALGRLLGLLPGHRLAQMGPALSDPRLLLAARRADGGPGPAHLRARGTGGRSPARST